MDPDVSSVAQPPSGPRGPAQPERHLPALPPDVVNGQPLQYRRLPEGRFVLYSLGWNGKDDGGVVVLRDNRYFDPKQGDWVWQYPAN